MAARWHGRSTFNRSRLPDLPRVAPGTQQIVQSGERRPECLLHAPSAEERDRRSSADDAVDAPDRAPLPDERAVAREDRERVRAAVAALPELYRVPIVLRYFSDLANDEIAAITGRPAATIGVQLLRARLMLRAALQVQP